MKKLFIALLLLSSTFAFSQSQGLCVAVDCKDTVKYPQDTVTLNGSLTPATGDAIKSALWAMKIGVAKIDNPAAVITVGRNLAAGGATLYVFQLTGTTVNGATGVAFDSVIYVPNKAPVAVTGAPVVTTVNTATVSGSLSTDPEGLPLTYAWTQISGPNTATINTATMANPLVSGLISGSYNFQLTVKDSGGLTSTSTQAVTVNIPVVTIIKVTTTVYKSDGTSTTTQAYP